MKQSRFNTLIAQLLLCFMAILASIAALVFVSWNHVQGENSSSAAMNELSTPFTRIYTQMNILGGSINDLNYRGKTELEPAAAIEALESIRADGRKVRELLNADGYHRAAVDLCETIDDYAKAYLSVRESDAEHMYAEASQGIQRIARLDKWMRGYLSEIGDEIMLRRDAYLLRSELLRAQYYRHMVILCVLVILICLMTLIIMTQRVVKPIRILCSVVTDFRLTDSLEALEAKGIPCRRSSLREIRTLATAIYSMQNTVLDQYAVEKHNERLHNKLNEEALRSANMEKQLQETQLQALQAQINPHFLFNTLNMIAQMSYIEGAEHTTELLETFSDYFRYNVDNFERKVTIAEELSNVRGYIHLQKERFGERIQYSFDVDDSVLETVVPCLILQPLVENAISHGLRLKTEGGFVQISIRRNGSDGFEIMVADNGCGMETEALQKLYEQITGTNEDTAVHRSIGVSNVFRRMRIAFGERAFIHLESKPEEGMTVCLRVEGGTVV